MCDDREVSERLVASLQCSRYLIKVPTRYSILYPVPFSERSPEMLCNLLVHVRGGCHL